MGDVTTPDAGSGDGGADAGVAPECAGLVPGSPGSAFTFDVLAYDNGESCDASAIDGEGVVAALARLNSDNTWYEFAPSYGARSGNFGTTEVVPQRAGFIGLWGTGPVSVALFTQGGEPTNPAPIGSGPVVLGPAYAGGVISLFATSTALTVRKHDAQAFEVASATVSGAFLPVAAAEDSTGTVLAITGSAGTLSGIWVDMAKQVATQPFTIATGSAARARPLQGGGIAVQVDGRWTGLVEPSQPGVQPPPAWLADAADFAVVRGAKAYALIPKTGTAVGIVSTQGNSCGTVAFPGVSSITVGVDGTVLGATGARGCTKFVWRNVLR
ncbi:MAG TPA: hypothetical protein VFA79_07945 [Myxococcales bacterium]|nr:hypothetical protein [Myxococcales bacterium]